MPQDVGDERERHIVLKKSRRQGMPQGMQSILLWGFKADACQRAPVTNNVVQVIGLAERFDGGFELEENLTVVGIRPHMLQVIDKGSTNLISQGQLHRHARFGLVEGDGLSGPIDLIESQFFDISL